MIEVKVACKDSRKHSAEVNDALKSLKKQMKNAGVLQDLKKHERYVPASKARKLKREQSQRQRRRDAKKQSRKG